MFMFSIGLFFVNTKLSICSDLWAFNEKTSSLWCGVDVHRHRLVDLGCGKFNRTIIIGYPMRVKTTHFSNRNNLHNQFTGYQHHSLPQNRIDLISSTIILAIQLSR